MDIMHVNSVMQKINFKINMKYDRMRNIYMSKLTIKI